MGSQRQLPPLLLGSAVGAAGDAEGIARLPRTRPAISGTRTLPDSYLNGCLREPGKGDGLQIPQTPARG